MRLAEYVARKNMCNQTVIGKRNGKITHRIFKLTPVTMLFKKSSINKVWRYQFYASDSEFHKGGKPIA